MTDENERPDTDEQPRPGPTKRLEKAIEDMETGDIDEGTLVSIEAHTGEHPIAPEPSVTDALKNVKRGKGPDVQPAATMYEPTKPGQASRGSTQATQFGPTGGGGQTPHSGSVNAGSGPRPIAPFGGKIVVGTRFGQIEVTGVLGKGGMGEVFKGYHHALDINVAIKVLPDELSRNELVRQRFLREARLCVKLDHPHIVRVFNVDEYTGNLYLVMEMVEGTDAAHMLKNGGRFRYKRALEIGAGAADALAYAHTQGLVHRDVKPHNILLGASDGKIKLSDFGLARAATSSSHLTMSGQIMGTPHYMSPEQAEAKEVTDKSDVYSLGVTVYHMLTGETPFVGDTPISVAVQHIAKEILYPEIRFKPFPKELVAVLKRMTAKDPAKRCSAKQAAVWLRKLLTMAPGEDVKVEDDQAMKSMAPVVRESAAFEAAAKEREARDFQARELARTMLATIQEDSGRRAAVPSTMQEQKPITSSQPMIVHQKSGNGALVGALVGIIVLLAGGGAGWWFMLGPGAEKANNAPIIAGGNTDNRAPGTNGSGNSANTNSNTAANNAPVGDDGGTTDDGGPILPDDSSAPPPEVPDEQFARAMMSAANSISDAATIAEMDEAKKKLDLTRLRYDKASAAQRAEFAELEAHYKRHRAYLNAAEILDRIGVAMKGFDANRGKDTAAAIAFMKTAMKERDALLGLKVPPEAEALVATDREAVVEKVNKALTEFWGELDAEAKSLQENEQYEQAEKLLDSMSPLATTPEGVADVNARLQVVKILGIHKGVRDALVVSDFNDADKLLEQAEKVGVPDTLKVAHTKVIEARNLAFETKLGGHISAARAAADEGKFETARNEQEQAVKMDRKTQEQKTRVADVTVYIDLSEQVSNTEKAIAAGKYTEAQKSLGEADKVLAAAAGRPIPKPLTDRLNAAKGTLELEVANKLKTYLEAATTEMLRNDFEAAGANLKLADELPLNVEQRKSLDEFKKTNEAAMADFVRTLIEKIEKALNENDFEAASAALDTADSLSIPADQKAKFDALRTRVEAEASKRHGELLEAARVALPKRNYKDARTALDSAAKIPVPDTEKTKAEALESEYQKLLDGDVTRHLDKSVELLDEDKYEEARAELDAAAALPLTENLDRQVRKQRDLWKAAVEDRLTKLLKDAEDARKADLYKSSAEFLNEAQKLPLNNDQKVRAGIARDEHGADLAAHKDKLFKALKDHVSRGEEQKGRKVQAELGKLDLTPSEQLTLKRLVEELTGETETARVSRLPAHLKKLWDDRYCKIEQHINVGEEISAVAVSTDGKFAAVGCNSGKVLFYNLRRGTQLGTSSGGRRRITCITISYDGTMAVCGDNDGKLVLFDLSGGSPRAIDLPSAGDDVFGLALNASSNMLYVATSDAMVHRYNPRTQAKLESTRTGMDNAFCLALSPDDNWLAVGGDDGKIAYFEASRMVVKLTLGLPAEEKVQRMAFSADSTQLIAGSLGKEVAVWDAKKITAKPIKQYKAEGEWVRGVGFTSDGRRCASFDEEYRLIVWDAKSGHELRRLDYSEKMKGEKDFFVTAGVIAPDGTVLIATREGELIHMSLKTAG